MHRDDEPGGLRGWSGQSHENLRCTQLVSTGVSEEEESRDRNVLETGDIVDRLAVANEKETHFQRR